MLSSSTSFAILMAPSSFILHHSVLVFLFYVFLILFPTLSSLPICHALSHTHDLQIVAIHLQLLTEQFHPSQILSNFSQVILAAFSPFYFMSMQPFYVCLLQ
jgi:hypothetical protein